MFVSWFLSPSPLAGEGWGEGAAASHLVQVLPVSPPSPQPSPVKGEGLKPRAHGRDCKQIPRVYPMSPINPCTPLIPAWQLRRAARWLKQGGLVAYPTEAVYGLGCDPLNDMALRRLLALKQRSWRKGLILIAAETSQFAPYLEAQDAEIQARAMATWPGAVSWLWPAQPSVSPLLRGTHSSVAVRIPAHPLARALCREAGRAIVSTSANRSGQQPARTPLEVRRKLGARAPLLILHGTVNRHARPSQIIDLLTQRHIRS